MLGFRTRQATGAELEKLQAAVGCVSQERAGLSSRTPPAWTLSFAPKPTVVPVRPRSCVAVLRQEGSNGDREMAAALHAGGLEPWDVSMTDLISGAVTLDRFRGIVFVGGFSYADVLDSAKVSSLVRAVRSGVSSRHLQAVKQSWSSGAVCLQQ